MVHVALHKFLAYRSLNIIPVSPNKHMYSLHRYTFQKHTSNAPWLFKVKSLRYRHPKSKQFTFMTNTPSLGTASSLYTMNSPNRQWRRPESFTDHYAMFRATKASLRWLILKKHTYPIVYNCNLQLLKLQMSSYPTILIFIDLKLVIRRTNSAFPNRVICRIDNISQTPRNFVYFSIGE